MAPQGRGSGAIGRHALFSNTKQKIVSGVRFCSTKPPMP